MVRSEADPLGGVLMRLRIDQVTSITDVRAYDEVGISLELELDEAAFADLCTGIDRLRDGKPQFLTAQEMREEAEREYRKTLVERYPVLHEDPNP